MKKNLFLSLFSLAMLADLIGIAFDIRTLQVVCKPILIPALLIYFFLDGNANRERSAYPVILALFCSWAGDVLLLFDSRPLFFLGGLSAFLVAHLFYIIFFYRAGRDEKLKPRILLILVVGAYYAILISFLLPYLGEMRIPVLVYGIVISLMLLLALHLSRLENRSAGKFLMLGAILFVISDSTLAVNKFYKPFLGGGLIVMLTYAIAQYSIMQGASQYLNRNEK
jgi:uncharacterized membrane protein YhhN